MMPDKITIGEKYRPAMAITEKAEADAYFEQCVEHTMRFGKSRAEAEDIERQNLGYYAGHYDNETRSRVERLFRCAHPIFGKISKVGAPTPEEARQAGLDAAKLRGLGQPCRDKAGAALDIAVTALGRIYIGSDNWSAEQWANNSIAISHAALDKIETLCPGIRERARGRG